MFELKASNCQEIEIFQENAMSEFEENRPDFVLISIFIICWSICMTLNHIPVLKALFKTVCFNSQTGWFSDLTCRLSMTD